MRKHIALVVVAALLGALLGWVFGGMVLRVNACGQTECQPHGGLTRPDLEVIIMGQPPKPDVPSAPVPPVGGDVPTQEEDAPPTPTPSPTASPTPSVGLVPPVSTVVPVQPTWVIPRALPKAGS